MIAMTELEP